MNTYDLYELMSITNNDVINKAFLIMNNRINNYYKIMCSISGGSDSDIIIDMIHNIKTCSDVHYIYFDTGLEYNATKQHLKYLENRYNINIEVIKPKVPIPLACMKYGQPFLSKHVSEMMERLQNHGFKWEDDTLENLLKKYPNCKSALEWWTNSKPSKAHNISQNKYLKEFIMLNPPEFKISQKCCKFAKKDIAKNELKKGYDLEITGIRRAEGGVRSRAYKNCYDINTGKADKFRPLFWFTDKEKIIYNSHFDVKNSRCYSEYGLNRTGCCGCPFGKNLEYELEVCSKYEPLLYKAISKVFKNSYVYTKKYNDFKKSFRGV